MLYIVAFFIFSCYFILILFNIFKLYLFKLKEAVKTVFYIFITVGIFIINPFFVLVIKYLLYISGYTRDDTESIIYNYYWFLLNFTFCLVNFHKLIIMSLIFRSLVWGLINLLHLVNINASIVYIGLFLYITIIYICSKDKLVFTINLLLIITFWIGLTKLTSYLFIFVSDIGGSLLNSNCDGSSGSPQGGHTEGLNSQGNSNPQGGGPNPPQGDGMLPGAAINNNDGSSEERAWSKAGASTNHDYGSDGYVSSDDYSEYNSDEGLLDRGMERNGFVSKSLAIFDSVLKARINSLKLAGQGNPDHAAEITGLKSQANVIHDPCESSLKIHGKVWDKFITHYNNNISPEAPLKVKPSKETVEIEGKSLSPRALVEEKGAILYLSKDKWQSLTNNHLADTIQRTMDKDAAKPVDWARAVAEIAYRNSH